MNEYYEYFGPDYELDVKSSNTDDLNTPAYLDRVKRIVLENLRHAGGPPSVQMSSNYIVFYDLALSWFNQHSILDIPSMPIDEDLDDPNQNEDFEDPNDRRPMRLLDSRRQADGELSDSEDEGEGGRRNHARYRDRETDDTNGGHKFGMGGGILNAGSMASHGAGPSGHTTAVRILTSSAAAESAMEVDTSSAESNAGGSIAEAAAPETPATEAPVSESAIEAIAERTEETTETPAEDSKMDVDPAPSTPAP